MTATNGLIETGVLTAEQASDLVEDSDIAESLDLGDGFLHRGMTKTGELFVLYASAGDRSGVIRLGT